MAAISPLLGLGIAAAGIPSAIVEGEKAGTTKFNREQDRQAARDVALQRKEVGDLKLKALGRADKLAESTLDSKTQALESELQNQAQQNRILSNKMVRNETYQALNNFFDSGDPQAMNQFFIDNKDNPTVQSMFKGVVRMDKVNPDSAEDRQMLRQMGISDDELDKLDGNIDGDIDWEKLKGRFVKSTRNDGEVKITDMVHLAAVTGYSRYADKQRLDRMTELADISKKGRTGQDTAEARNADRLAPAEARIAKGEGTPEDYAFVKVMKTKLGGTSVGKEVMSSDAIQSWTAKGYDNLSQEELQANPDAMATVRQIELANPISNAHQKELLELNSMIALSKEAGQLTDEQTGLYDKWTNNITSYTSDEIGGKVNKAAYSAFMVQLRHNLMGSVLTPGELASFKEAYSGLGQKTGPVLAGLRAAMTQIKSKMQTIYDLNDPRVMKARTGQSREDINAALTGLNQRIKFYDKVASGMTPDEAYAAVHATASADAITEAPQTVEDVTAALGL